MVCAYKDVAPSITSRTTTTPAKKVESSGQHLRDVSPVLTPLFPWLLYAYPWMPTLDVSLYTFARKASHPLSSLSSRSGTQEPAMMSWLLHTRPDRKAVCRYLPSLRRPKTPRIHRRIHTYGSRWPSSTTLKSSATAASTVSARRTALWWKNRNPHAGRRTDGRVEPDPYLWHQRWNHVPPCRVEGDASLGAPHPEHYRALMG